MQHLHQRGRGVRGGRITCVHRVAQVILPGFDGNKWRIREWQRRRRRGRRVRKTWRPNDQARLRRRSVCRRVVRATRVSRRSSVEGGSSVDRVASISETVLRIPFKRWAVWNQGLIDFMLNDSDYTVRVFQHLSQHILTGRPIVKKRFLADCREFSPISRRQNGFCKPCALH